jgi:NAD(P)H-dependent FMN reductase
MLHFDCPATLKALLDATPRLDGRQRVTSGAQHGHSGGQRATSGEDTPSSSAHANQTSLSAEAAALAFARGVAQRPKVLDERATQRAAGAVAALAAALRAKRTAAMCERAERRTRGLATRRFCNASFLLARLIDAAAPQRRRARGRREV